TVCWARRAGACVKVRECSAGALVDRVALCALALRTILGGGRQRPNPGICGLRPRSSLTAIVENDDPRADESCAPAENPAGFDGFDNGEEAMLVINRIGNPMVSLGDVPEMNISMPVRHGMFVARLSVLADELERLARSKVLIRIAADLDPDGRSASQLS